MSMEKQSRQSHYRLKDTLLFRGDFESLCRISSSRRGHLNARLPLRGCQLQAGGNGQPQPRRGRPMLQLHLRHVVTVRRIYLILEEMDTEIGCAGMDVLVRHDRSSASRANSTIGKSGRTSALWFACITGFSLPTVRRSSCASLTRSSCRQRHRTSGYTADFTADPHRRLPPVMCPAVY